MREPLYEDGTLHQRLTLIPYEQKSYHSVPLLWRLPVFLGVQDSEFWDSLAWHCSVSCALYKCLNSSTPFIHMSFVTHQTAKLHSSVCSSCLPPALPALESPAPAALS